MADQTLSKADALENIHYQWFRDPIHTLYDQTAATNTTVTSIDTRLAAAESDIDDLEGGGYFDCHYAGIYCASLQSTLSVPNGAAYTLVNKWTGNLPSPNGATPDYTNSKITLAADGAGAYHVIVNVMGGLASGHVWTFAIHVNGSPVGNTVDVTGYGDTSYWQGVTWQTLLSLSNSDVIDVRVRHNGVAAQNLNVQGGQITVIRLTDPAF